MLLIVSNIPLISHYLSLTTSIEIKKKRKISNYNVFFRHLHKLLKQVTSHVPFHLEGLYWKKLTDVQRQVSSPTLSHSHPIPILSSYNTHMNIVFY